MVCRSGQYWRFPSKSSVIHTPTFRCLLYSPPDWGNTKTEKDRSSNPYPPTPSQSRLFLTCLCRWCWNNPSEGEKGLMRVLIPEVNSIRPCHTNIFSVTESKTLCGWQQSVSQAVIRPDVRQNRSRKIIWFLNHSSFPFTYPLTAGVVGAPQMTSQPISSIFLCSPLPSGTWQTPGLFIF